MVCNRQLDIATAQEAIVKDWIGAYHAYHEAIHHGFRREPPVTKHEEQLSPN